MIVTGLAHLEDHGGGFGAQLAAGAAALLTWTERRWPRIQEAIIGMSFVLAAALGILLLAGNPHGGDRLRDLLAGQILWVSWNQLLPVAILYLGMLAGWKLIPGSGPAQRFGFYALFAIAVTASVQLVGVYLVFASLIAPAVVTLHLVGRRRLLAGFTFGMSAYALGLSTSLAFESAGRGHHRHRAGRGRAGNIALPVAREVIRRATAVSVLRGQSESQSLSARLGGGDDFCTHG